MFYGRENEIKKLCAMFRADGQRISLIYGRRRIGKSELIKQVLKETDCKSIYYECKQTTEQNNTESLAELIGETFDFPKPTFENMEALLCLRISLGEAGRNRGKENCPPLRPGAWRGGKRRADCASGRGKVT